MAAKKQAVTYAAPEYIACSFVGCPTSALVRVRTKTGMANVCPEHDKALAQKSADAYCKARGLDTVEKMRAWVRTRKPLKRFEEATLPEIQREAESIPF